MSKEERAKTAKYRFYKYNGKASDTYPFTVCDAEAEPRAIARFKQREDADLFLAAVRQRYVDQKESSDDT